MKATNILRGVAAAAFISGSMLAVAEQPNYNYLEIGYGVIDIDDFSLSGDDGYWGGFSAQIAEPFYLNGSYQRYSIGGYWSSADLDISNLNFGYRTAISNGSDFNFELGYDRIDTGSEDYDGFRASAGIRSMWANSGQSRFYAGYTTDSDGSDGDYFLGLQGTYAFSEHIGFTLQLETYEFDLNIIRGGFRLEF